jgi:hypothetical protein
VSTLIRGWFARSFCQQGCGGCNELAVSRCRPSIRKGRRVFQTGPDAVPARHSPPIDGPRRDAVAMVDLLERHASFEQDALDRGSVSGRSGGIVVKRFDERTHAARGDRGTDEHARIVHR